MGNAIRNAAAAILVALVPAAVGAAPVRAGDRTVDDGRSEQDLLLEAFLLEAEVVAIEEVGEGVTHPQRLTLRRGNAYARAIFKTVDEFSVDPAYTSVAESTWADRYVNEVAAYRIDRLLGIGLVPVTVVRQVDGRKGSVQWWIEDAIDVRTAADIGYVTRDPQAYYQHQMAMVVLDEIIANIDRNPGNVLRTPGDDGFWLIDHSRAFRTRKSLSPWDAMWTHPVPPEVVHRAERIDESTLAATVGDLLSRKQIRAMLVRRDRLLVELRDRALLSRSLTAATRNPA